MNPSTLAFLLTFLISCLLPILHFPEVFLGSHFFGHPDFYGFSLPIKKFYFESIWQNTPKYFYPFNLLGTSLFSGPHYQIFYLPNLLWILFPFSLAFKLQYIFNYPLFACGLFLLLKQLNFSNRSSALSAVLTCSCGIIWSMHTHPNELDAVAWMPISFFFALKIFNTDIFQSHSKSKKPTRILFLKYLALLLFAALSFSQIYFAGDPWGLAFCFLFVITFVILKNLTNKNFFSQFTSNKNLQIVLSTFLLLGIILLILYPFYILHSMSALLTERHTGFSKHETFMYSSHWMRIPEFFLPWLIPGFDSPNYPWKYSLSKIYPGAWYYEIGFGLVYGLAFIRGSLSKIIHPKEETQVPIFFILSVIIFLILLSTGINSEINLWMWDNIPYLSTLRFPERLLKYSLVPISILTCLGFHTILPSISKKLSHIKKIHPNLIFLSLLFISLLEMNYSFIAPNTISSSILNYPTDLYPLKSNARLLVCDNGIPEFPTENKIAINFHPIAWGISTVYEAEAMVQPMNKLIDCKIALTKNLRDWIGFTHVLTPYYPHEEATKIEQRFKIKLLQINQEANFSLFETDPSANLKAIVTSSFSLHSILYDDPQRTKFNPDQVTVSFRFNRLIENDEMFFDPNLYLNPKGLLSTSIAINHIQAPTTLDNLTNLPSSCAKNLTSEKIPLNISFDFQTIRTSYTSACKNSLLVIPYAFTLGWQVKVNGEPQNIYRINDWVMGVLLKQGYQDIVFQHSFPNSIFSP